MKKTQFTKHDIIRVLRYAPVLAILPLLSTRLPIFLSPAREFAGYYQALAFADDPILSYTYITLQESDAALHLSSVLASPFVAIGYMEGGRLVSLLAAVSAAIGLAYIAARFFGEKAALIAPVVLWINPYFLRYTWTIFPEAVSIALTVAAVAAMIQYLETSDGLWFIISLILCCLGIANHAWEATIGLPLFVLLVLNRDWVKAGILTVAVFGAVGAVFLITQLQPIPADTMSFAITNVGLETIFSWEWWRRWFQVITLYPLPIYSAVHRLHMLLAFPALGWWIWEGRNGDLPGVTMASWILTGMAIPFGLPGGVHHSYYLWGLVAPLTLTVASGVVRAISFLESQTTARDAIRVLHLLIIVGVILSCGLIGVYEGALGPSETARENYATPAAQEVGYYETTELASTLRDTGVDERSDVAFVGNWSYNSFGDFYRGGAVRVLTYAGIPMKGTWHQGAIPGAEKSSPPKYDNLTEVDRTACEAILLKYPNGTIEARSC